MRTVMVTTWLVGVIWLGISVADRLPGDLLGFEAYRNSMKDFDDSIENNDRTYTKRRNNEVRRNLPDEMFDADEELDILADSFKRRVNNNNR